MIGYLEGVAKECRDGKLTLLTTAGVGYLVRVGTGFSCLDGERVELFIHTALRENEISLWGFKNRSEIDLFEMLISVSGVGLKTAMSLVAELGVDQIVTAVGQANPAGLKVSGVGSKTAERIVIDLKGKLELLQLSGGPRPGESAASLLLIEAKLVDEIADALLALGYKKNEVLEALKKVEATTEGNINKLSPEEIIRATLRVI